MDCERVHFYEAHIQVADAKISEAFYREVVGLPSAHRDPARDIVFLWVDQKRKGIIGLWGPSTGYDRQNGDLPQCHLAFAISLEHLRGAIQRLDGHGIETCGFGGNATSEPSVNGWMPPTQIYFRDPEGHSLEFITILPQRPNASFVESYSGWQKLNQGLSEDLI